MDTAPALRLGLLGELTATVDGVALDLGGPRQRAVLAVLLLARGEAVPADRVVDAVWGDDPPADSSGALQSYVSHLRRRLEPGAAARTRSGVIVRQGPGYAVRLPDDAVDAWRFEALLAEAGGVEDPVRRVSLLTSALGLWRGPALADHADEAWAQPAAARLTELRDVAREQLLAARLDAGDAAVLVPELDALVAEQPLREERWRLLVLALYRAHRQADALAALRRARTTLADELGVDPGPALRALEQEVLAQSPSLDIPQQRLAPVPAPRAQAAAGHDLVDRTREIAALEAAIDDVLSGEPRLVLVEGAAGIGKTRLLQEARRLAAARGWRVTGARGSQLERSFGFGAVRQVFEPVLTGEERGALLSGAAASARGVFDLTAQDAGEGSFAVLHGLYWLTVNLAAEAPLLVCVDDVQWCDAPSLRFLAYLVRRLEGLPVLVVATLRTGEQHDDEALLAELALDPATVSLRPGPLSAEATAELVRSRLGEPAPRFVDACHRTTSGNPLLLRQLLRALEADGIKPDASHAGTVVAVGSRAVSSLVLVRLRRMSPVATTVARAVAVLGEGAALPVVAALTGLPEPEAAVALTALARAEILREEQPLGFVHPLVGDAVYRDVPAAERELEHDRAAQALRQAGASDEVVAAHLLLAPSRGSADSVDALRRAARTAADRGASDSAVTYLRRALAEPPAGRQRADVLLELGLTEGLVDGPASAAHLAEALPLLDDARARGETAVAIARMHLFASPPGVATRFARDAAATLPADVVDVHQALAALRWISGYMQGLEPALWRTLLPAPSGRGHGARMLAAVAGWERVCEGTDRARSVELCRSALEGDRLWEVDDGLFWVVAATSLLIGDDHDSDLGDFWDRARTRAHSRGSLFMALSVNLWAGYRHWRRGDLLEAQTCLSSCEEQNRIWGTFVGNSYARAFEIAVATDRGDAELALRVFEGTGPELLVGDGGRLAQQMHARALLELGRPADALAAVERAVDPSGVANPAWNPWRSLRAAALHGLGRTTEAKALLDEEVPLLRRWGAATGLGPALRLRGELLGDVEDLREAVAELETVSAALELARARTALAEHPATSDADAVALLRPAVDAAHVLGARPLRERALAALVRRGADTVPCDAVPVVSGTARRVLALSGAGHDVRDIAQELFLTPGAVQAVLDDASAAAL